MLFLRKVRNDTWYTFGYLYFYETFSIIYIIHYEVITPMNFIRFQVIADVSIMEPETKLKLALLERVIVEKANILTLQLGQIHQTLVRLHKIHIEWNVLIYFDLSHRDFVKPYRFFIFSVKITGWRLLDRNMFNNNTCCSYYNMLVTFKLYCINVTILYFAVVKAQFQYLVFVSITRWNCTITNDIHFVAVFWFL